VTNGAALVTTLITIAESTWAKTRGDSLATAKDLIPEKATGFLLVPRTAATWWPYQMLWDLQAETDPTVCKSNVENWLPYGFAQLELVNSISDTITAIYKRDDYASDYLFWTAMQTSFINFTIGVYGLAHTFMKAPYWTWQKGQYAIRPPLLSSYAMVANCYLYASAAYQYYDVTVHGELRVGASR
jgi:hypothetical protein